MEILILWAAFVAVGGWVGSTKGRTGMGVILSMLFGLIGIIIVAVLPSAKPE